MVGFLNGASPTELSARVAAFRDGLAERGYVEGNNVAVEYRWGLGQYDRLPDIAVDLVRRGVAVIAATGGVPSVRAATAATSTIPIVFTMGGDPVALGLVQSLNRPGGNVTGITLISGEIGSKRIALLRDLLPGAKALGILLNSTTPASEAEAAAAERVAHTVGWRVTLSRLGRDAGFCFCFSTAGAGRGRRPSCNHRSGLRKSAGSNRCAGSAPRNSSHVRFERVRRGWRAYDLWREHQRRVSAGRLVCR